MWALGQDLDFVHESKRISAKENRPITQCLLAAVQRKAENQNRSVIGSSEKTGVGRKAFASSYRLLHHPNRSELRPTHPHFDLLAAHEVQRTKNTSYGWTTDLG